MENENKNSGEISRRQFAKNMAFAGMGALSGALTSPLSAMADQEDKARELLAGINHEADNGLPLALVYASLDQVAEAMYWADQVAEIRMPWYPWLVGWFPQFRALHDNPQIIAWAEELGVPLQEGPG